jgi:tRNA pseudouridine38-40 synthase
VVAFDTRLSLPARAWVLALSAELSDEIAVVRAAHVPAGYDPRRHVRTKTYRYVVFESAVRDPFLVSRAWRVSDRLNQHSMSLELPALIGEHDFAAFRSAADERPNTVRTILRAELRRAAHDARLLELIVQGNSFMHRMMRIIAGTVVDIGRGRLAAGACARAMGSRLRTDLGITAPAGGLYLDSIELEDAGQDPWPAPTVNVDGSGPVA